MSMLAMVLLGAVFVAPPMASAEVAIVISVSDTNPALGDTITYTIEVPCSGDGLTDVTVDLPSSLTVNGFTSTNGGFADLVWTPQLSASPTSDACPAILSFNAIVGVDAGGAGVLTTTATGGGATASAAIEVDAVPLTFTKSVDNPFPDRGDNILYTIEVPCDSFLGPITITDLLPADVAPNGTVSSNNGLLTIDGQSYQWEPNLDPRFSAAACPAVLTIPVLVLASATGVITNTATGGGVSASVDITLDYAAVMAANVSCGLSGCQGVDEVVLGSIAPSEPTTPSGLSAKVMLLVAGLAAATASVGFRTRTRR